MNQHFIYLTDDRAFPFIPGMDKDLIKALNGWRMAQDSVLDPNEAILCLLRRALAEDGFLVGAPAASVPSEDNALDALVEAFRKASSRA